MLQISRTKWLPTGRQVKDSLHVAFPEELSAADIIEAAPGLAIAPVSASSEATRSQQQGATACRTSTSCDTHHVTRAGSCRTPDATASACDDRQGGVTENLGFQKQPAYHLAAVVRHDGLAESGHYTCFRKVFNNVNGPSPRKHTWFEISDASVRHSSLQKALSADATMLVYVVAD
jgi:hypothetical protein